MFKKDATQRQPRLLRELSGYELLAVTGGDGSTTSGTSDGSNTSATGDGSDLAHGKRVHKPIVIEVGI